MLEEMPENEVVDIKKVVESVFVDFLWVIGFSSHEHDPFPFHFFLSLS